MDIALTATHPEYSAYEVVAFLTEGTYKLISSNNTAIFRIINDVNVLEYIRCDCGDTVYFEKVVDGEWVKIRPDKFELKHHHVIMLQKFEVELWI